MSYNKKKPTKKEFINKILPQKLEAQLKQNFLLGVSNGFEYGNIAILHYINKGKTLNEVKEFVQKNISNGKEAIMKVYDIDGMEDFNLSKENVEEIEVDV